MPMALSNTDKRETHVHWISFTGQPLASTIFKTVLYHNVRPVQGLTAKGREGAKREEKYA